VTKNEELHAEMAAVVADLWEAVGLEGVNYSAVAAAAGRARGSVQHFFGCAEDMVRAGAVVLASRGGVLWMKIEKDPGGCSAEMIARAEAWVWLARHGAGGEAAA
jgi:hypothetical protein